VRSDSLHHGHGRQHVVRRLRGPLDRRCHAQTLSAPKRGTLVIAALSSYLLLPLGWLLFGIASFRARVYPRILSVAIMIAAVISYGAGLPPYGIPLGLAVGAVGAVGVWCLAHPERRSAETTERLAVRP
jgi:hypothetical protein